MKILIIITTGFVSYGGLTTVMMNYYRFIDKTIFQIDFASTNEEIESTLKEELSKNGSRYYPLGDRKKEPFRYLCRLDRIIKNGNYDVVHVNSNSATAALELCIAKKNHVRKRIVHNHTGSCEHILLHKLLYPLFLTSYTDSIAVSEKAGEWLFPKGTYTILENGIDCEKYRFSYIYRTEIRKKYGISDNTIVIGHLGKLHKSKNHHFLIQVFNAIHNKCPNSVLLLVGDGELRSKIEEEVERMGINDFVIFAGMQFETQKYLSAMDYFVFPSLWEGMPLSMIEAQASGLACFISDRIDAGVCITDAVYVLSLDKMNAEEWADFILETEIRERNDQSESNIKKIKDAHFDVKSNVGLLEKVYVE